MEKMLTRWGKNLDKNAPLQEYPRPQMVRESYINLNGIWDYAILPKSKTFDKYQGQIVVPFSPESILSGVEKNVSDKDFLYYRKVFNFNKTKERVLLHFGAVDYECEIYLNGKLAGKNKGGYYPFYFDVTDKISNGENVLTLRVSDPSDKGEQARGKQKVKRGGIWYTPQSGIWQTVWIEEVCENYIERIKITPNIDENSIEFEPAFSKEATAFQVVVLDKGTEIAKKVFKESKGVIKLEDYQLWSPENPYLYDYEIYAGDDKISGYFGMRKFSLGKDSQGITRLMLNNKPYFHNGLLDQGYWSDGIYTPASDEAFIYDIKTMKEMGFNMLRKHIKLEPLRWYYHCDKLGMIVWQDMISGGRNYSGLTVGFKPFLGLLTLNKKIGHMNDGYKNYGKFSRKDEQGRKEYYKDSQRLLDTLYNTVSLGVWVPFNEGWGQFDSLKACDFYRKQDPTRLIDHASGWHDQGGGDLNSFHIYFTKYKFPKYNAKDDRAIAVTEFGGYSIRIKGHMYNDNNFGYRLFKTKESYVKALEKLYKESIADNIKNGLSACVYTEVSDVEEESNGLLTYDREIIKIDIDKMKEINRLIKI